MNKLNIDNTKAFEFEKQQVRIVQIKGRPYFVGKDVASVLGYASPRSAISKNVPSKYKGVATLETPSGAQEMTVISEPGIYKLAFKSHAKNAEKFTDWVAEEVLPSIRKHGAYMTDEMIEKVLTNPNTIIEMAEQWKAEREKRLIAEQRINELTPKATYYDTILANKSLVTITQIAKDYGMSGKEMNKVLHELKVQYKQGSTWLLYSKYQRNGWTHSETTLIYKADGTKKAVMSTKWTQKGRLGIYELLKAKGIIPLIEQGGEEHEI